MTRLFNKNILAHSSGGLELDKTKFKQSAKKFGQWIETNPLLWLRGGLLGLLSLTFNNKLLNFLQENKDSLTRK